MAEYANWESGLVESQVMLSVSSTLTSATSILAMSTSDLWFIAACNGL